MKPEVSLEPAQFQVCQGNKGALRYLELLIIAAPRKGFFGMFDGPACQLATFVAGLNRPGFVGPACAFAGTSPLPPHGMGGLSCPSSKDHGGLPPDFLG